MSGSFTEAVKQELAGTPVGPDPVHVRAELAALLRFGGALVLSGGTRRRVALALETTSGATARRAFALLQAGPGIRPELSVRSPGGVQRRSVYGVLLDEVAALADGLGLLDPDGLPAPTPVVVGPTAVATARGAFLAAGSISAPGRAVHLEVACHGGQAAQALAATLEPLTEAAVSAVGDADRWRVVCKSGRGAGELLARLGASSAFLVWDEQRLRRQLRADATRLANADGANLRRSVTAAAGQVAAVERLVAEHGWDGVEDDLRAVALARLTSPEASLSDLGQLTDPPLSRSAVHRRLVRIVASAADLDQPADDRWPRPGR